ncbi:MAG: phosphate acyltransferase PlsX [Rhodothermales bacterium]
MSIRIAIDAMGGDDAPSVVVDGAARALRAANGDLEILLVGRKAEVRAALAQVDGADGLALHVVDALEVIGMGEAPAAAVKAKQGSSIHVGLGAHKSGKAHGFISAGNTGAVMAASLFILGRLEGVARPSVIGFFPTTESYSIVLDVGTNVDCRPEHLVQFAKMGSIYAKTVMKREDPVVALLNVGEEPGKGNDLVKSAFDLLSAEAHLNFRGNVEGRDLLHHAADVVVCDGFVGNILLKFGESVASAFPHMIAEEMARQKLSDENQKAVAAVLSAVRKRFNYEEYGGAPLLGVNGNVIIGHGGSTARAFERMILTAAEEAREGVVGAIADAIGT